MIASRVDGNAETGLFFGERGGALSGMKLVLGRHWRGCRVLARPKPGAGARPGSRLARAFPKKSPPFRAGCHEWRGSQARYLGGREPTFPACLIALTPSSK